MTKKIAEIFNEKYIDADYLQNNNDKPAVKIWEELADDDGRLVIHSKP